MCPYGRDGTDYVILFTVSSPVCLFFYLATSSLFHFYSESFFSFCLLWDLSFFFFFFFFLRSNQRILILILLHNFSFHCLSEFLMETGSRSWPHLQTSGHGRNPFRFCVFYLSIFLSFSVFLFLSFFFILISFFFFFLTGGDPHFHGCFHFSIREEKLPEAKNWLTNYFSPTGFSALP